MGEMCPSCPGEGETDAELPELGGATTPNIPRSTRQRPPPPRATGSQRPEARAGIGRRQPAERLHHFRVEKRADGSLHELGRGGMGVTYKAFDERLRLPVALKVIAPFREHSTSAQSLFLREARAAARVRHSNVASVLYLNDTPGNFFYAMEFVDGISLEAWLKAQPNGRLDPLAAISLAEQIARGLAAIHDQGIIHRDLKPSNIMLVGESAQPAEPGRARLAKIIDFGLARPIARSESGTQSIGFRGTALYASPEQCEELSALDGRSDLYSLGCILFQMLAGAPPFLAATHRELMNQHVSAMAPVERLAEIPPDLRSVVARLLAKSPDERPATAEALLSELEHCRRVLRERGPGTAAGSPAESHKSWVPRVLSPTTGVAEAEPIVLRLPLPEAPAVAAPLPAVPVGSPIPAEPPPQRATGTFVDRVPAPAPPNAPPSTPEAAPAVGTLRRWAIAGAAVFAVGLMIGVLPRLGTDPTPPERPPTVTPAAATPVPPTPAPTQKPVVALPAPRKGVAVLPFANLSGGEQTAYFADGMHEDIVTNLAKLREMRVISRSSVIRFKPDEPRDLKRIAEILGVTTIVEGTVRRADSRIRVTVQLIDAATGDNLWAESFDREVSDVIAIQSQIALAIADALKTSLSVGEKNALTGPAIGSANAYELFAKARAIIKSLTHNRADIAAAEALLEEATRVDPTFGRAFAQLSLLHTSRYANGTDRTEERLTKANIAARRAIQVGGEFAEANLALGTYFFRGNVDWNRALDLFRKALLLEPQNAEAMASIANVQRRMGQWEESVANYAAALQLNPLDPGLQYNYANSLRYVRRYAAAEAALDEGENRVGPHFLLGIVRGDLHLQWRGDPGGLRNAVAALKPSDGGEEFRIFQEVMLRLYEGRHAEARRVLEQSRFNQLDGQHLFFTRNAVLAEIAEQAGERERAKALWRTVVEEMAPLVATRSDPRLVIANALALAGAGEFEAACKEADRAVADKRVRQDHFDAPYYEERRALIYLRSGRGEEARAMVEALLSKPGGLSRELLEASPVWKSLPPAR